MNLFEKAIDLVFGTKHERDVKRMRPIVEAINALEAEIEGLDDECPAGSLRGHPGTGASRDRRAAG